MSYQSSDTLLKWNSTLFVETNFYLEQVDINRIKYNL
jgi:hypothetical protein